VRTERPGGDDVETGMGRRGGGKLSRDVGLAVVGRGEQQRYDDRLAPVVGPAACGQRPEDLGERRRAVVEERRPHVELAHPAARGPGADNGEQLGHRRRGARVTRAVGDGDERRQPCRGRTGRGQT
jgi:hypothetical protein